MNTVARMISVSLALTLLLCAVRPATGTEIEGVHLADRVRLDGSILRLNGVGVRSMFIFDIYVCALYLPRKTTNAKALLLTPAPARVVMRFLLGGVGAERLRGGWRKGFRKNQDVRSMQALQDRLRRFNGFFGDVRKGDEAVFDFTAAGRTLVRINGRLMGEIPGVDFQRALLAVWLGAKPADEGLKKALLAGG